MTTTTHVGNPVRQRHSPCIGVCKLDDSTGQCLGCARTGAEVAAWSSLDESAKDAVWSKLPGRLASLSIRVRLMPWTADEIEQWVHATITSRRGTWVTGVPGAVAEFPCHEGRDISAAIQDGAVIGRAPDALFRLRVHDKLRAFAFTDDGPIVLGLPWGRVTLPVAQTLTALGPDRGAIDPKHSGQELFDFGVGRRCSRFCIRTSDSAVVGKLQGLSGRPWSAVLSEAGKEIIAESPARVVESELARIEVFSPIPLPGGKSPSGAHTHFLPQFLASGDEVPPALALPDYAGPVAIFYPG